MHGVVGNVGVGFRETQREGELGMGLISHFGWGGSAWVESEGGENEMSLTL